jgi:biopolymer transport protein ExbD
VFNSIETNKRHKARIELIPMIDVMMFLLVFFVLISLNVIPGFGLGVNLPSAAHSTVQQAKKTIVLSIQKDGQIFVGDQPIQIGDLHSTIQQQLKADEKPVLIINGDSSVEYRYFVQTLDALKGAGYTAISIATKKS